MVLYNLYLVLNNEKIKVYDRSIKSCVYVGPSDFMPVELMRELVHDMTIVHEKNTKGAYFLINLN